MQRFLDLNISRENELQNIVTLAAETCQTPVAVLLFVDNGKIHAKYKAGMIADQITDRSSFSHIALTPGKITIIPNTLRDPRTASDYLVTGPAGIRFYAGVPLITHDNKNIGTLYVMGREPKELSQRRQGMLQILSRQAVNMVEFDMSLRILKEQFLEAKNSENKLRSFFESSSSSHALLGHNMEILTFNKTFYDATFLLLGVKVKAGMSAYACIPQTYLNDFITNAQAALAGESVQHERVLEPEDMQPIWTRISYKSALDNEGKIIGVSFKVTDITKRKKSEQKILEQNEALRQIAYMQSHGLRKPVASILGLMNLIKMEGYGHNEQILCMMEKAVLELDDTIHHIIDLTEAQPEPKIN